MSFFIVSLVVLSVILVVELHYLLKDRREGREVLKQLADLHADLQKLIVQNSVEQKVEDVTATPDTTVFVNPEPPVEPTAIVDSPPVSANAAAVKKSRKYRKKSKTTSK